jgi:hypothetical protein
VSKSANLLAAVRAQWIREHRVIVALYDAPDGEPCAYEYSIKDAAEREAVARREYDAGRAVFSRI